MNRWLKLALFAFVGILVSSLALGMVSYTNSGINGNMANMNMNNTNSASMNAQNMNMGTSNTGSMYMGRIWPGGLEYAGPPWLKGGINPMQNRMFYRMNTMRNWMYYPN